MMQLVNPDALQFSQPVNSYWEASADPLQLQCDPLPADESCDVAIIGGGYTGLSAALELASQGVDVRLLEAGHIGWGASGRNGGFACIGSHKLPYARMIATYGLGATQAYYRAMRQSVDLVDDMLRSHDIDAWKFGSGEITLAHLPQRVDELREEQAFLRATFGDETTFLTREALADMGAQGPGFHAGLMGRTGFGLHPLNYVRGLARAAAHAGAKLHAQSRLMTWEEHAGHHLLHTTGATLRARRVLVATNGYTPEDVSPRHAGRILPALSSILVTRPLTRAEMQAQSWTTSTMAFDSRNLLHYFRLLPNGRFLFGGRGGTDSSNAAAPQYREHLTHTFHDLFPAWANVEITHFWRGFVCLAYDRVPFIGTLDDRRSVWTALAYHGNGVAMGTWCGRAVARMMTGRAKADDIPAVITHRLAKFPLPAFRPLYLKGAYLWYGWQDSR